MARKGDSQRPACGTVVNWHPPQCCWAIGNRWCRLHRACSNRRFCLPHGRDMDMEEPATLVLASRDGGSHIQSVSL